MLRWHSTDPALVNETAEMDELHHCRGHGSPEPSAYALPMQTGAVEAPDPTSALA